MFFNKYKRKNAAIARGPVKDAVEKI